MGQMPSKFGGGLADDSLEYAVEMCERLKSDFVGNFADPKVRVQQEVPGSLNAHPRKVFRKVYPGEFFEHLAEIKCAAVHRFGDLTKRQLLPVMLIDVFFGSLNHGRFGVVLPHDNLVAEQAEVFGKDCQKLND